jgi:hypothetical protein
VARREGALMGEVITLPQVGDERTCLDCTHAFIGHSGIHCALFGLLWEELLARDCETFEEA